MAAKGSLTKHGFPRGYRFVPKKLELISLLAEHIHGGGLPPPLAGIFHELSILDYHPKELYERFKNDAEDRYIYFFSWRAFQKPGTGGVLAVPEDKDQKEPRPVRVARGGGWKPSGGGHVLSWPRRMGGFVAGRMVTMVFYDRVGGEAVKSNWGMHEFVVPVDRRLTSLPNKYTRFYDLALYRLYILKSGDIESESEPPSSSPMMPNASSAHFSTSTSMAPCPPIHPCGIFTGNQQQLLAAGVSSSSQMPPPRQQQQQQLPCAEYSQYYHHHQQQQQQHHAFFGNTASGAAAAQQQVRTMPMPVLGAELPSNTCHFAIPPAPATVRPSAADPGVHQAPVAAATQGAGQEAGHSWATCSPPAIGSSTAAQHATVTTEPAHAQLADDCVKPKDEEEAAAPPLEEVAPGAKDERTADADEGTLDWRNMDLTPLEDSRFLWFSMDEIMSVLDDLPAMEGDKDNKDSGGEKSSQADGSQSQEEPPAALIVATN